MKIAFIHDVDDWSFHNIGRAIAAASDAAGAGHEFRLVARRDWAGRPKALVALLEWADLHVFLWRFDLVAAVEMLGAAPRRRARMARLLAGKITLSVVYDHLYDSPEALAEMGDPFALSDLNAVCSGTLARHYGAAPHLFVPDAVLIDGVDLARFTPPEAPAPPGPLRVGWVGNSDWGTQIGPDMKGFHTVFRPALAALEAEGLAVARVADKVTNPLPGARMPDFYRDLDVLACTSLIEGTPNPVLEAMAAGAAVVSTDVGVVRDVLGPAQQSYVIAREPQALADALRRLAGDRAELARLKAENRARRDGLSWQARFAAWQALFARAGAMQSDPARIAAKEARLLAVMGAPGSRLARLRRRVLANRHAYGLYMHLLERRPRLLAAIRNRLR